MTGLDPKYANMPKPPDKPPDKPEPYECCNRGCCPCILDYYWDALERWETLVRQRGGDPGEILESLGRPKSG